MSAYMSKMRFKLRRTLAKVSLSTRGKLEPKSPSLHLETNFQRPETWAISRTASPYADPNPLAFIQAQFPPGTAVEHAAPQQAQNDARHVRHKLALMFIRIFKELASIARKR